MILVNNWTWLRTAFYIFPLFQRSQSTLQVLPDTYLFSPKIILLENYFSCCSLTDLIQEMMFLQWHSESSQGAPGALSIISVKNKALPVMENSFKIYLRSTWQLINHCT